MVFQADDDLKTLPTRADIERTVYWRSQHTDTDLRKVKIEKARKLSYVEFLCLLIHGLQVVSDVRSPVY